MSVGRGTLSPGDVVAGKYRIEDWLGQGNMAAVYRAVELGSSQVCALKLVHAHLMDHPSVRESFLKEARIGARIGKNPHIVDVFDSGIDEARGAPYLAMELLNGESLDHSIKRGPMPKETARAIFQQLGSALSQAHAAGIIHRDLKPANLFLTRDAAGEPQLKIVDFGIAKFLEQGGGDSMATQIGSPGYAAPEQIGGAMRGTAEARGIVIARSISPGTDIWALGLIAYELLLGAPPGHLWTVRRGMALIEIVMSMILEPTPAASSRAGEKAHLLPPGFDAWLDRCLMKNAAERWPNAGEAIRALVKLMDGGHETNTQSARPVKIASSIPPAPAVADDDETTLLMPPGARPELPPIPAQPTSSAPPQPPQPPQPPPPPILTPVPPVRASSSSLPALVSAPPAHNSPPVSVVKELKGTPAGTPLPVPTRGFRTKEVILSALAAFGVVFILLFALLPKKSRLTVHVKETGGETVPVAEVFIDGKKRCDKIPCIVDNLESGRVAIRVIVGGMGAVKTIEEMVELSGGEEKVVTMMVSVPMPASKGPADK